MIVVAIANIARRNFVPNKLAGANPKRVPRSIKLVYGIRVTKQ